MRRTRFDKKFHQGECRPVRGQILAYLDGELNAEMRTRMQAHLHGCAACREELSQFAAGESALGAAKFAVPPAGDLRPGFYAWLAKAPQPSRRNGWQLAVPALAAAGLFSAFHFHAAQTESEFSPPNAAAKAVMAAKPAVRMAAGQMPHQPVRDIVASPAVREPMAEKMDAAPPEMPNVSAVKKMLHFSAFKAMPTQPLRLAALTDKTPDVLRKTLYTRFKLAAVRDRDGQELKKSAAGAGFDMREAKTEAFGFQKEAAARLFFGAHGNGKALLNKLVLEREEITETAVKITPLAAGSAVTLYMDSVKSMAASDALAEAENASDGVDLNVRDDERGFVCLSRVAGTVEERPGGEVVTIEADSADSF